MDTSAKKETNEWNSAALWEIRTRIPLIRPCHSWRAKFFDNDFDAS